MSAETGKVAATLNPSKIMQVGMGFMGSKVLLTAVKLEVFTLLASSPLTAKDVKDKLGLHCTDRHVFDWLDGPGFPKIFSKARIARKCGVLKCRRY